MAVNGILLGQNNNNNDIENLQVIDITIKVKKQLGEYIAKTDSNLSYKWWDYCPKEDLYYLYKDSIIKSIKFEQTGPKLISTYNAPLDASSAYGFFYMGKQIFCIPTTNNTTTKYNHTIGGKVSKDSCSTWEDFSLTRTFTTNADAAGNDFFGYAKIPNGFAMSAKNDGKFAASNSKITLNLETEELEISACPSYTGYFTGTSYWSKNFIGYTYSDDNDRYQTRLQTLDGKYNVVIAYNYDPFNTELNTQNISAISDVSLLAWKYDSKYANHYTLTFINLATNTIKNLGSGTSLIVKNFYPYYILYSLDGGSTYNIIDEESNIISINKTILTNLEDGFSVKSGKIIYLTNLEHGDIGLIMPSGKASYRLVQNQGTIITSSGIILGKFPDDSIFN